MTSMTSPINTLTPINPMSPVNQNAWLDDGYKEEELVSIQLPKAYMENYCITLLNENDIPTQEEKEGLESFLVYLLFFTIFAIWAFKFK